VYSYISTIRFVIFFSSCAYCPNGWANIAVYITEKKNPKSSGCSTSLSFIYSDIRYNTKHTTDNSIFFFFFYLFFFPFSSFFSSFHFSSIVAICETGEYSTTSGSETKYGATDGQHCQHCPIGFYQNEPGQGFCKRCNSGLYSAEVKTEECSSCPVGYSQISDKETKCDKCPEGKVQPKEKQQFCTLCSPGTLTCFAVFFLLLLQSRKIISTFICK
tara:strand:- start:546 stop:1193 length:648 start_codon:yes stop_codon:yes gene_type:complete